MFFSENMYAINKESNGFEVKIWTNYTNFMTKRMDPVPDPDQDQQALDADS
jgi:hypothetical protein